MRLTPYFRPPQRKPLPPAHSVAELAREFGVSRQCLQWALQRPDAPKPVRTCTPDYFDIKNRDRYHAAEVRAWWKEIRHA
jgi:hypothetical protein